MTAIEASWRSPWGSAPAWPATASRSEPPPNGSRCSPTPNAKAASTSELDKLARVPLLVVDEVGYIPFDPPGRQPDVHARQPPLRTRRLIVTSNKPFSAWGEIFGDDVVATAMIDRLVHHAEILSLKGDSYRLKDRDLARPPAEN